MKHFASLKKLMFLQVLGLFYNFFTIGYTLSGMFTIMSHATIFGNLGGISLIILKLVMRKPVHKYEIIGLVVAISGCIIATQDKSA